MLKNWQMKERNRKVVDMVVVEYSSEEMMKLTGLDKEKIIEGLTEIGAPTEESEQEKLISELTPNRPDWFSMEGLARALRSYYKGEIKKYEVKKSDYKIIVDSSVRKIRPYTVGTVIKGIEFDEQRIRDVVLLQEKLNATLGRRVKKFGMGVYPLEGINFPVRYTTMKPEEIKYKPLNYPNKADANEIIEKHPKGQEYGYLIEDFKKYPVFLDNENKIMCLIPVVNSAETGQVNEDTKDIFIEVTGIDMHVIVAALNILACTFADMGGTVYTVTVEYPGKKMVTPDLKQQKMKINVKRVNKLLGVELTEKQIGDMLKRMGYEYKNKFVLVPPYRADIIHEVDLIEDVAIVYGYNKFEVSMPDTFTAGKPIKPHVAHEVLRGMGFMETQTFILTNKDKINMTGYDEGVKEITNPSGEEFTCIRTDLMADMLSTMVVNKMKGLPQMFYEIGVTHKQGKDRKKIIFGVRNKNLEFAEVRGYLQTLMREMGGKFELKKKEMKMFDDETSAEIIVGNKIVGVMGKVKVEILEKFNLDPTIYICEICV